MGEITLIQNTTAPKLFNSPGAKTTRLEGTGIPRIAARILQSTSNTSSKISLLNRIIVRFGKKWWTETTVQDSQNISHRVLVNINSAVKRTGLTREQVVQASKENNLVRIARLKSFGISDTQAIEASQKYDTQTEPLTIIPDGENRWIVFYNKKFLVIEKSIQNGKREWRVIDILQGKLTNLQETFGAKAFDIISNLQHKLKFTDLLKLAISGNTAQVRTDLTNISEQLDRFVQQRIELESRPSQSSHRFSERFKYIEQLNGLDRQRQNLNPQIELLGWQVKAQFDQPLSADANKIIRRMKFQPATIETKDLLQLQEALEIKDLSDLPKAPNNNKS